MAENLELIKSKEAKHVDGVSLAKSSSVGPISPDDRLNNEIVLRQERISSIDGFQTEYNSLECFRIKVNSYYFQELKEEKNKKVQRQISTGINVNESNQSAVKYIFKKYLPEAKDMLKNCILQSKSKTDAGKKTKSNDTSPTKYTGSPFDRRIDRVFIVSNNESIDRIPFSSKYQETSTTGLIVSESYLQDSKLDAKNEKIKQMNEYRSAMQKDSFYIGAPSLVNAYSLTKLYGSDGGNQLLNKRGERKWYEVDKAFGPGAFNSTATNPTTSSLISWGSDDPYGRTPYSFTDFVFSKYWNKIENNRLITLRRYGAPINDNLKFPGMDGDNNTDKVIFPPMASAITYFGEETGNKLSELLKFTTGLPWDDVKSDVWQVNTTSTPDSEAGPAGLFPGIGTMAKMLNVATGNFDVKNVLNKGILPPDPYSDGPYENRILGPVNRINSVKKRVAGLTFEWSGLNLVFEYVARPIGGINPKAVLLDILSNFLVIGSASAVFFGGQHRFMADPGKYPFLGGQGAIDAWYNGQPLKWAGTTITSFVNQATDPKTESGQGIKGFMDALLGGGGGFSIKGLFDGAKNLVGEGGLLRTSVTNLVQSNIAERSSGQVPYLSGLKALLTGEAVGEWHVTIGNPLNPIVMIGNLICNGVEVEFGNELGPDDFPTELKITVKLDHGMPRDRDAIQSVFNRGMGRIYDLPDGFEGSGDKETKVDKNTSNQNTGSISKNIGWLAGPSTVGSNVGAPQMSAPSNGGEISIWRQNNFRAISPDENLLDRKSLYFGTKAKYRAIEWIGLKATK